MHHPASPAEPRRLGALFGLIFGACATGVLFYLAIYARPAQPQAPLSSASATSVAKLPGPIGGPTVSMDVNTMIGKPAPRFTLSDSEGRTYPVTPGGTSLVLIYDGSNACDQCVTQLLQLQGSIAHMHDHADVFVISDQTAEASRRLKQATGIALPLLLDQQLQVTRMYDMLAKPNQPGQATPGAPQMGFVVVDGAGAIRTQRVDTDFGDHADQIVQILHAV